MNATFGIKGVQEHCFFLKTMEDAKTLRRHIRYVWRLCWHQLLRRLGCTPMNAPNSNSERLMGPRRNGPLLFSRCTHPCSTALELAALPDVTPEERRRMLQFVICGGGPTGVETAAELMDLVSEDIAHHMPQIKVGWAGVIGRVV